MKKNELKYKETKKIGENTFIDVEIGLRYIKENFYSYFYAVGDVYELKRARKKNNFFGVHSWGNFEIFPGI